MGAKYNHIPDKLKHFIAEQKLFFVATADVDGRVSLSPKGLDSLRVLSDNRVVWLNLTGSGNETATHVQNHPRMTLMFMAFSGKPMILRLYGKANVIHQNDRQWQALAPLFDMTLPGARQIFDLDIDLVQASCGTAVPLFDYVGDRSEWLDWSKAKGKAGIQQYWRDKNQVSLDGKPTHILSKNIKDH